MVWGSPYVGKTPHLKKTRFLPTWTQTNEYGSFLSAPKNFKTGDGQVNNMYIYIYYMTLLGSLNLHAFAKLFQHHTQHPIVNHHVPRFFVAFWGMPRSCSTR